MDLTSLRSAHPEHWRLASAIRALTLDAVAAANSGHSGMPMGMADVATVLFDRHLRFDPQAPFWPDRDRFILSNCHGSMLIYALLHLTGYDLPIEELKHFRQLGHRTPGHPENFVTDGVETTTGPLGQGFANAVGFAMYFGVFGAIFLIAPFFQVTQGFSPLEAGIRTLPWTAMPIFVAPIAGILSDRIGPRPLMAAGLAFQAVGIGWLALVSTPAVPYG